uniref:Uncharacterized protein n=1 Tax=Arundo donax TaxID=35708 RepID=A0A0A9HBU9_ARUDO
MVLLGGQSTGHSLARRVGWSPTQVCRFSELALSSRTGCSRPVGLDRTFPPSQRVLCYGYLVTS